MTLETRRAATEVIERLDSAAGNLSSVLLLAPHGLYRQAVSSLYYAVYQVGMALVVSRGSHANTHAGVIASVDRLVVGEGTFATDTRSRLEELMAAWQSAEEDPAFVMDAAGFDELIVFAVDYLRHGCALLGHTLPGIDLDGFRKATEPVRHSPPAAHAA